MPYDNEEIINELQRVGRGLAYTRHGRGRTPEGTEGTPEELGFRGGRSHEARTHGIGNHKCHGGSGRHGQNRILAVLVLQDGTSQKDLAYLLGIRPQSLTQALEALEADGFITRKADEADKRSRLVYLTDAGRDRAARVAEDRKTYADEALSVLSAEEREQLGAILEKLAASLDEAHSHTPAA